MGCVADRYDLALQYGFQERFRERLMLQDYVTSKTVARDSAPEESSNPPHGEKGSFRPISVTLPPGMYSRLIQESARRKMAGEANQLISAMVREAVTEYLRRIEERVG